MAEGGEGEEEIQFLRTVSALFLAGEPVLAAQGSESYKTSRMWDYFILFAYKQVIIPTHHPPVLV